MFGNNFLLVFGLTFSLTHFMSVGEPDLKRLVTFETFETKYLVPIYLLSDAADTYR